MKPILAGVHRRRQLRIFTHNTTVPEATTIAAVTIPPDSPRFSTLLQTFINSVVNNCQLYKGMQACTSEDSLHQRSHMDQDSLITMRQ